VTHWSIGRSPRKV